MAKISTFSSFQFPNYRLYFTGSVFSDIGSQMQMVAIAWQVYELTRSPAALGLLGLAGFFPILIFSLLGGLTADTVDRRKLLIVSQVFQAGIATLLAYASNAGFITPALIYIMIALTTVAQSFQAPARQAIIPHLVPKEYFMNAISLNTLVRQASLVVGPSIAGFIIAYYGVNLIYMINAISYIVLIGALALLKVKVKPLENKPSYSWASIMEGVRFVKNNPILRSTMILDFLATFFSSATTLLPIFATDILKVGPQGLGFLYAAPAIGAILTGLIMASFGAIRHQGKLIVTAVILYGAATLGFGLSKIYWVSLIFLGFVGAADMISMIFRNTIRQLMTPDYIRGRMTSVNMIFIQGGPLIGEAEAGFVAALTSTPFAVATGGLATIFIALIIAFKSPQLMGYHNHLNNQNK